MDKLQRELRTVQREAQNQILVENSEIHIFQKEIETLRNESMGLEMKREREAKRFNDQTRESGQIILSVKNLYQRCLSSMGGTHRLAVIKDNGNQIEYMQSILKLLADRMVDLDFIVTNYKTHHVDEVCGLYSLQIFI